jgi:pimeloyl-ACP methyl ester carboxylesterase
MRATMNVNHSIFKSIALEKQYMAVYQAVLDLWKVSHEALDVSTRFGSTHINAAGAREKPALLLLPGFGANSSMWFPNIAALSSLFRVFAVDTNGQPGKSLTALSLTAANSAEWLAEVLDGLGLEKAHLAGISLGGWLALDFAIRKPGRTDRLVLIDPAAAFARMSPVWVWHSLLPVMIWPTRAGLVNYFRWMTRGFAVNPDWGELMLEGILNTWPQPPIRASAFTEQELRSVRVPVLVLIGGRSVIYDPHQALQRTRLIPGVMAEIIPNASHALNAEASGYVNLRMLDFLKESKR